MTRPFEHLGPELEAVCEEEAARLQEPSSRRLRPGRYDARKRRRPRRSGREAGCWTYIPAEELERAGFEPGGELPYYRVWGSSRGGLFLRLYREP